MTRDELLEKLNSVEWNDIEFKEAGFAVPKSALETVSAFANTKGGHLVFGIKEGQAGNLTITGVLDVDKVQNDFLGQTRNDQKISVSLPIAESLHSFPEGEVICFFVPEASTKEKPVYLDQNPKKTYVRKGGGDYRCSDIELKRFLRDSGSTPFDSETLDLSPETFFSAETVRWYRSRFEASNPGKNGAVDDLTFLRNWGYLIETEGSLKPTRAAVLTFGDGQYVRQQLPRMVVDLQLYRYRSDEYSPTARWADRITVEENLIEAWKAILDFFQKHSERPFSVDSSTLRRDDDPPDYISFREAAINLLIHQDYGDPSRVPVIRIFRDKTEFYNPGDAFASREQLLDPGDKEVRNPKIVNAFRRIGLSDQGGTGVAAIFDSWRRLGYLPPEIDNDKAEKSFRLSLRRERLQSEEQLLAQANLGVQLSEHEAAVFGYLIRKGGVDIADIKALTGLPGASAVQLAERLTVQVIVQKVSGQPNKYALVDHLAERYGLGGAQKTSAKQLIEGKDSPQTGTEQVTEQVDSKPTDQVALLRELTSVQWVIVRYSDTPRSFAELMREAGYSQRPHFKATHLEPLIGGGVIRMTIPDKPTSSKQRYVLTEAGLKLKELRRETEHQQQKDDSK
ncbi:RNA-binding domain-containing protein [Roseicitreum antarcticum]|uniref:ATP-dependent DNA helicase RecG n=1 Tax=Roseicitreum antarcticum TaxID=564137 RepID=A0A1H3DNQ0_9RHOB|nr:RNA-binding domain-containing protein [Roseicitreum antarcticum]SDX67294.1 ATP-dependent DNA helicase RecG [Roseicitreum antarcticum]